MFSGIRDDNEGREGKLNAAEDEDPSEKKRWSDKDLIFTISKFNSPLKTGKRYIS